MECARFVFEFLPVIYAKFTRYLSRNLLPEFSPYSERLEIICYYKLIIQIIHVKQYLLKV